MRRTFLIVHHLTVNQNLFVLGQLIFHLPLCPIRNSHQDAKVHEETAFQRRVIVVLAYQLVVLRGFVTLWLNLGRLMLADSKHENRLSCLKAMGGHCQLPFALLSTGFVLLGAE
jgi:hypothetical protein